MKQIYFTFILLLFTVSNYSEASPVIFYKIKKDTAASRLYLDLGIEKYEAKNYKGALSYFEEAIKNDEANWEAYRYKGNIEFVLKKYQESINDYTKVLSINKLDTLSYIDRGEVYAAIDNWQEAIKDYTIANQMGSNEVAIYFQRGYCNYMLKQYQKAIQDYTKAIKLLSLETGNYEKMMLSYTYYKRGTANYDSGKYRETVNDFNKYLNMGGNDINANTYRGRAYMYLSQKDSALIDFNKVIKEHPNNSGVTRLIGIIYSLKKDSAKANKYFRQSIKLNPNDPETYFFWASSELDFGNYFKAVELLETAMKNPEPEPGYDAYFRLGWAKAGIGDTLGAITAFDKAVAKDSNRFELYDLRTYFLSSNLRYRNLMIKDCNSIIRLIEDTNVMISSKTHQIRSFLKFSIFDTTGAMEDINKAIAIVPDEPIYYVIRAAFNFTLNNGKELMLKDLDKAISLDSSLWEAYLWKVSVYQRYKINNMYIDSDYTKACENLKKGIKNGGKVSTEVQNYICKGKLPKNGTLPDIFFYLTPQFKNQKMKDFKQKISRGNQL